MTTTATQSAPGDFGGLLKSWRAARKLSQLDLALHSSVSQRHLSFLESGRARPSQHMVMQLSEALEVPLRERNTLLLAAGYAAFYQERGLDDATMAPVRDALSRTLEHHLPYPALVVDRAYNIVQENVAFSRLLALFGDVETLWRTCCGDGPRNLLRLTFHPAGARPRIRNFDEVGPLLLQRAWREALLHGGAVKEFILELRHDESLPADWHRPDPAAPPPPVLPLELGDDNTRLSLFSMISTFGTPSDITTDEIRVETFFPADSHSENLLRKLAGG